MQKIFTSLLFFFSVSVIALDDSAPIEIISDTALFKEESGLAIHEGDVVLTQGKKKVLGDKLFVYKKNKKITHLEAIGAPASCVLPLENKKEPLMGYAKHITWDLENQEIVLEGNAEVENSKNVIQSDKITYSLTTLNVKATSNQGGRTKLVINPNE